MSNQDDFRKLEDMIGTDKRFRLLGEMESRATDGKTVHVTHRRYPVGDTETEELEIRIYEPGSPNILTRLIIDL